MSESALTIFQELEVPENLQLTIANDEEFQALAVEDQREYIIYQMTQAGVTTEGVKAQFGDIKLLHAGAVSIEMPTGAVVKTFEGVLLDQSSQKAFWEGRGSDGSPPDCQSADGIAPAGWVKNPVTPEDKGGCLACPHNKFGSAINDDGSAGRGKRCRDARKLVVKLDGHSMPCRLQLPATVIKALDKYLSSLVDANTPLGSVLTKFDAVAASNRGNQPSTAVEFSTVRKLSIGETLKIKREVVDVYKEQFRQGSFTAEESGPALSADEQKAAAALSSEADAEGQVL